MAILVIAVCSNQALVEVTGEKILTAKDAKDTKENLFLVSRPG